MGRGQRSKIPSYQEYRQADLSLVWRNNLHIIQGSVTLLSCFDFPFALMYLTYLKHKVPFNFDLVVQETHVHAF